MGRALDLLQAKAGIACIALRHTYTSLALRAGLPPKVVSSRLRHKSVQLTRQVYQKLMGLSASTPCYAYNLPKPPPWLLYKKALQER